jgi:hypothetical protein
MDNTGLANAVQQLACVGVAAPTADWASYMSNEANIPIGCADGTSGTVFSNTAPNVTMFDKNYVSPRSVRSNLQWNGPILNNRFSTTIEATYSLNLNQASTLDLNFNPAQQFALANEGGRPIFAQSTSIVPVTGTVAAGESRVTSSFNHVSDLRSDGKSEARQISITLQPTTFSTSFTWGLAYVYSNTRELYRGFASTAGNPLDFEWSRSSFDSRHQIQYRFTYNALDWVRFGWNGSIRSGSPFTALVGTDINGDGYANDRAFIFNPASVSDTALANGLRSLMSNGSASARDCLSRQLNQLAARNSCEGPWFTTAILSVSFNPIKVRMPQRATLSFALSNPLGAADMLVHGDNNLHGWGQAANPQSQLFYVRGFDATSKTYQ